MRGHGHTVNSHIHNFRVDAYTAENKDGRSPSGIEKNGVATTCSS